MKNLEHLNILIDKASEKHHTAYYSWIKFVITLSSGALTLLVGLQKHYIAQNPECILLLQASWVFLFLTICLGLIALYGKQSTHLDVVDALLKYRTRPREERNAKDAIIVQPKKHIKYAQRALPLTFGGALLFLVLFAVLNV